MATAKYKKGKDGYFQARQILLTLKQVVKAAVTDKGRCPESSRTGFELIKKVRQKMRHVVFKATTIRH